MAVEGRTWNLNLRLSFFLGRGVRKYKLPGHVTVPVPHIHTVRYSFRRAETVGFRLFFLRTMDVVSGISWFSVPSKKSFNILEYRYLSILAIEKRLFSSETP